MWVKHNKAGEKLVFNKIKKFIKVQKHKNTTQVGNTQQSREKLVLNKNKKQKSIQIQKYKITK